MHTFLADFLSRKKNGIQMATTEKKKKKKKRYEVSVKRRRKKRRKGHIITPPNTYAYTHRRVHGQTLENVYTMKEKKNLAPMISACKKKNIGCLFCMETLHCHDCSWHRF